MDMGGISWGLQTIAGATILAAALPWAPLRSRRSRAVDRDVTERTSRTFYREGDARRDDAHDRVP